MITKIVILLSSNTTQLLQQEALNKEVTSSDPYGIGLALTGMGIVFSALLLLYLIFRYVPVLLHKKFWQKKKDDQVAVAEEIPDISGEENAAIALAISLYINQLHDYENTVLTIKKVSRTYSPWSSKIYGINPFPKA